MMPSLVNQDGRALREKSRRDDAGAGRRQVENLTMEVGAVLGVEPPYFGIRFAVRKSALLNEAEVEITVERGSMRPRFVHIVNCVVEAAQLEMRPKADKGDCVHHLGERKRRVAVIVKARGYPRIVCEGVVVEDADNIGLLAGKRDGE